MPEAPKILLLDDDPDVLEMFEALLAKLSGNPIIKTANSGPRALALLESEPFTLLICDLNMPKMDGLQVLALVRRKYPQLRTVVLTAVADEHFRTRAYATGVDLFLQKPTNSQEIQFFIECIESILNKEEGGGFRGIQSKSLVDIIQLEGLSQSSGVLKITNGAQTARIWFQNGDVVDAEADDLTGDKAFQKIMSWRGGTFEMLPPDPSRERTIFSSYQGLLLESAQALDEAQEPADAASDQAAGAPSKLSEIGQMKGVEFALIITADGRTMPWGLEHPEKFQEWMAGSVRMLRKIGDQLRAGELSDFIGTGPERTLGVALAGLKKDGICLALSRSLSTDEARETLRKAAAKWVS